jgi:hypothetical protein
MHPEVYLKVERRDRAQTVPTWMGKEQWTMLMFIV